jgi:hypothetical protein
MSAKLALDDGVYHTGQDMGRVRAITATATRRFSLRRASRPGEYRRFRLDSLRRSGGERCSDSHGRPEVDELIEEFVRTVGGWTAGAAPI